MQVGTSGPRSKVTGPCHCADQREGGLAPHQAQGQTFPRSQCIRRGPNTSAAGHPAPSSQVLFLAEEHLGLETRRPEARLEPAKAMSLPELCPPPVGSVLRGQVCPVPCRAQQAPWLLGEQIREGLDWLVQGHETPTTGKI